MWESETKTTSALLSSSSKASGLLADVRTEDDVRLSRVQLAKSSKAIKLTADRLENEKWATTYSPTESPPQYHRRWRA